MTRIGKSLCWAAAFLLLALGGSSGLMDRDAVRVLLIALPVVAWLSIIGRGNCRARSAS
jgi:hypothetical protein